MGIKILIERKNKDKIRRRLYLRYNLLSYF